MEYDIYQMQHPPHIEKVLDELRKVVHDKGGAGITIQGNRVTIRWGRPLKDVHMVLLSVSDGAACAFCKEEHNEDYYCAAQAEAESK